MTPRLQTEWAVATAFIQGESSSGVYANLDDLARFVSGCPEEPTREGVIQLLTGIRDAHLSERAKDHESN